MGKQVNVGVIGTSWFTDNFHLRILANYERAALVAVCGRNRERAEEMAVKHDIAQVFTDYHQMIDSGDLEAIVVVSPDDLHYEMVMAALNAGLHVFCEKPLALNADQAKTMYDKAEAAGVRHMVNFTWRWAPNHRHVKQLLDDGYLGQMRQGVLRYIGGYGRSSNYLWRFDGDRAIGALGDLGSHMIDLARWFMGDIVSVSAHLATFVDRVHTELQPVTPINDAALLILTFANGAHASIQLSAVAHVAERNQEQSITLHGQSGTLETQLNMGNPHYSVCGASSQETNFTELAMPQPLIAGVSDSNPLGWYFEQPVGPRLFIDCILDDKPGQPSFYDGYKVQQVIDAALQSYTSGCCVTIS